MCMIICVQVDAARTFMQIHFAAQKCTPCTAQTTHTQALLYNQPLLAPQPDGTLVLQIHVLLRWRSQHAAGHAAALQAAAPEYWLKLKRPQAVAEASAVGSVSQVCYARVGGYQFSASSPICSALG